MNLAFSKYWVEGTQEAVHKLYDAIANAEGFATKAFENLGLDPEKFGVPGRAEWSRAQVEDKDGYSVVSFREFYPWEKGDIIYKLMDDDMFADKLTELYYYAEDGERVSGESNDKQGKYWPYRYHLIGCVPIEGVDSEELEEFEEPYIEGHISNDARSFSFYDGYLVDEYFTTKEGVMEYFDKVLRHPIKNFDEVKAWHQKLQENDEGTVSIIKIRV